METGMPWKREERRDLRGRRGGEAEWIRSLLQPKRARVGE